ncbi:MAG: PilZ domain-containing protein [Candidatus Aminicenantes bacterium]|nr:PilZ domain-containing protein [Candidatus Aminicenantes bacterium]
MEKRKQKRKKSRILVKINGKSGILIDYSETGLQISTNSPPSKKMVDIQFDFGGKEIFLKGVIQWIKKRYLIRNNFQVGCILKDPPGEYFQFLQNR